MNLRPSGYEPDKIGGFLPTKRGGGHMVDTIDKPNTTVEICWKGSTADRLIANIMTRSVMV